MAWPLSGWRWTLLMNPEVVPLAPGRWSFTTEVRPAERYSVSKTFASTCTFVESSPRP